MGAMSLYARGHLPDKISKPHSLGLVPSRLASTPSYDVKSFFLWFVVSANHFEGVVFKEITVTIFKECYANFFLQQLNSLLAH